MKSCEHCGIGIRGNIQRCPLCNAVLAGTAEESGFPPPAPPNRPAVLLRILALFSIAGCLVCALIARLSAARVPFALYAAAGVLCFWVLLGAVLRYRRNLPAGIAACAWLASAMSILWDGAFGSKGWSMSFVLPVLCVSALTILFILWPRSCENCTGSLLWSALLGVPPAVLLLCGSLSPVLPAAISTAAAAASVLILLLFRPKQLHDELSRRFHM